MYPSDFRTSFSGLSQEGWEMELEWGDRGVWGRGLVEAFPLEN